MSRIIAPAYGGPEVLTLVEEAVPEPSAGQVVVDVRAIGVNPIDYKIYSGGYGADPAELPKQIGFEAAGVVSAIGHGVTDIAVDDEVIVFRAVGTYATQLVVDQSALTRKPADLSWPEAAGLMLTGATAVHALTATEVAQGDTVLIHGGAGGVGQMAIQLAVLRGARVIASGSSRNHALLTELGAEPVVYGPGLTERVQALTDHVDAALDLVGTDEALETSLALVSDVNRIATIANFVRGPQTGIRVLGGGPGADPGTEIRDQARGKLAELAGERRLKVRIDRTFPLAEAAAAHTYLAEGHASGKVVLIP